MKRAPVGRAGTSLQGERIKDSVAHEPFHRMFGYETVTTGVAGPEIADQMVVQVGGCFRGYHGVSTHRAGRQIAPARIRPGGNSRQDFSNCWHLDLPVILDLSLTVAFLIH
jgi:hypothetical protein